MAVETEAIPLATGAPPHPLVEFWRYLAQNRGALAGLAVIVILLLLAALADLVSPHSAILNHDDAFLKPPVWQEGGIWLYPLGTDAIGRDMLSRLIHGARYSLFMGTVVVVLALSVGIVLGLVAGFF